jgi:hypothetical protein
VVALCKYNHTSPQPSLVFKIANGKLEWEEGTCDLTADELQPAPHAAPRVAVKLPEAKDWLLACLQEGPVESKQLLKKGLKAGHAKATVRRAMSALKDAEKAEAVQRGRNIWWWTLRPQEEDVDVRDADPPGAA